MRKKIEQTRPTWTADRLRVTFDTYFVEHQHLCLDPNARNIRHTYVVPSDDKKPGASS